MSNTTEYDSSAYSIIRDFTTITSLAFAVLATLDLSYPAVGVGGSPAGPARSGFGGPLL